LPLDDPKTNQCGEYFYDAEKKHIQLRVDGRRPGVYEMKAILCRHTCPEPEEEPEEWGPAEPTDEECALAEPVLWSDPATWADAPGS